MNAESINLAVFLLFFLMCMKQTLSYMLCLNSGGLHVQQASCANLTNTIA